MVQRSGASFADGKRCKGSGARIRRWTLAGPIEVNYRPKTPTLPRHALPPGFPTVGKARPPSDQSPCLRVEGQKAAKIGFETDRIADNPHKCETISIDESAIRGSIIFMKRVAVYTR